MVDSKKNYIFAENNKIKTMATLTLQVENPSLMEQLKSVLSLMKGVRVITSDNSSKSRKWDTMPNAITLAAMKEAESGNDAGAVCTDNLDSFIKSMED